LFSLQVCLYIVSLSLSLSLLPCCYATYISRLRAASAFVLLIQL
jgi:hypothetical protein